MAVEKKWLLIVDDEAEIRDALRELINVSFGDDVRIVEAVDGLDATTKIKNQMFHCIITDMKMPKKEGDAFIPAVRQNAFNEATPIIVLTGYPNKKIIEQFQFTFLMEKPFKHDELLEIVTTQLKIAGNKNRLAADMVNNVVEATKAFLKEATKEEKIEFDTPKAKRVGEPVDVEYLSKVEMKMDNITNSFHIMSSKDSLTKLVEKMPRLENKDHERISHAMGQSILTFALRKLNASKVRNANIESYSGKDIETLLKRKAGIIIPINAGDVSLQILACGEIKT